MSGATVNFVMTKVMYNNVIKLYNIYKFGHDIISHTNQIKKNCLLTVLK